MLIEEDDKETNLDANAQGEENKDGDGVEFTDTQDKGKKADEATDAGESENKDDSQNGSDKAKNAEQARARREREVQARIDKAVADALSKQNANSELEYVKTYVKVNKFTNEPINDLDDLDTYKTMLEMEEKGLNPTEDYAKYATEKRRAERKANESTKKTEDDYFKLDTNMLVEAYGRDGAKAILEDDKFMQYFEKLSTEKGRISILAAKAKYDRENAELGKKAANEEAAKLAKEKLARELANEEASTGKVGSANSSDEAEFFSFDQLRTMSEKDIEKNWDKVKKSYEKLNKK